MVLRKTGKTFRKNREYLMLLLLYI